jgi:hypothetical protein
VTLLLLLLLLFGIRSRERSHTPQGIDYFSPGLSVFSIMNPPERRLDDRRTMENVSRAILAMHAHDDIMNPLEHFPDRIENASRAILMAQVDILLGGAREFDLQEEALSVGEPAALGIYINVLLSVLHEKQTLNHLWVGFVREDEQSRFYSTLIIIRTMLAMGAFVQRESNELTTLGRGLRRLMMFHIFISKLADTIGRPLPAAVLSGLVSSDNENGVGFLDPILHAMNRRHQQPVLLFLGDYDRPVNGPSLITVEALHLFLQSAVDFDGEEQRWLRLSCLGLGDDHCKVVAESLVQRDTSLEGALGGLDLSENPAIGQAGYENILWLLNRAHWLGNIRVDDTSWQAKFKLVADMNTKHGRGEFLQSGVFDSNIDWVDWLARLAALDENDDEADDPNTLNFIWYSLVEKPEFIS